MVLLFCGRSIKQLRNLFENVLLRSNFHPVRTVGIDLIFRLLVKFLLTNGFSSLYIGWPSIIIRGYILSTDGRVSYMHDETSFFGHPHPSATGWLVKDNRSVLQKLHFPISVIRSFEKSTKTCQFYKKSVGTINIYCVCAKLNNIASSTKLGTNKNNPQQKRTQSVQTNHSRVLLQLWNIIPIAPVQPNEADLSWHLATSLLCIISFRSAGVGRSK